MYAPDEFVRGGSVPADYVACLLRLGCVAYENPFATESMQSRWSLQQDWIYVCGGLLLRTLSPKP